MPTRVLWSLILLGLCAVAGLAAPAGKNDGTYLHDVRMAVPTPHIAWLQPHAKGAPKVLFLARRPGIAGRTIVELAQRMSMAYTAFLHAPDKQERDYWEANIAGSQTAEKEQEAIDKLSRPYDAIVLIGFDVNWLPKQAQYYLLRQVQGGTGLIAADCNIPWKSAPAADGVPSITAGVPLSGLPAYAAPDKLKDWGARRWEDLPARLVQTGTLGRGRVALIRPSGFGIEPEDEVYCNYHYALYLRALQWVIPAIQPDITLTALPEGQSFERAHLPATVQLKATSTYLKDPAALNLVTVIRNPLGDIEARQTLPVAVAADNTYDLPLPPLPAGPHFYDCWFTGKDGKIVQFGSFAFTVTAPDTIAEVAFDTPFHDLGDPAATVTVRLAQALSGAAEVRLTATDTYGRQVARVQRPVARGATEAQVKLPLTQVAALAQWVRADLLRDRAVVSSRQVLLIVRRKEPIEFPSLLWGGVEHGLDGLHQLRRQRDVGFNIAYVGATANGSNARFAALADMQFASYATRVTGVTDGTAGKVTNPAVMKKWVDDLANNHRSSAQYGIYVYSLGDESFQGAPEQPFAPSDVAAFRAFLQAQFGTLAELNRVWQTQYATFDEITPIDWNQASDPKLFPQKHARLAFIESLYARTMHELSQGIKAMDRTARVGAEGSDPGDMEETLRGLEMWGPYSDRRGDVLLASLAPRSLVRGMWWGGYHGGTLDRPAAVNNFWRQVFEGVSNTNFFFDAHIGHHESNVASDLSWADYFEQMLPSMHELYETPAPLIAGAAPRDFGVALLWSQPSEHAGLFYALFTPPAQEMLAQFTALDANGVNYRFVTARQLAANGLDPKAVKLLMLPMTTALSGPQAEALQKYVEAGGVLFADGSVGLMDGQCALLPHGQLDALLGLQRAGAPAIAPLAMQGTGTLLGKPFTVDLPGLQADTSLRAAGAEVVLAAGEVPLLTVKRVGKGVAVFLNGSCAERLARGDAGLASVKTLVAALLDAAQVRPLFAVEPLGALRVYSHALGSTTLLSVVRNAKNASTIRLTEQAYVYDVLDRKALGKTDTVALPDGGRGFALFTLSETALKAPNLKAPATAQCGTGVKAEVDLPGGDGRLVRLDVYRPDGSWVRIYRRFATVAHGKATVIVPLALNDPAGAWQLTATDLASGLQDTLTVTVK